MAKKTSKRRSKKKTTKKAARGTKKTARKARGRKPGLKAMTTQALLAEVARREKEASRLEARRSALLAELAEIDRELSAFGQAPAAPGRKRGPAPGSRRGPRPSNKQTLEDALVALLNGREMGVAEAADAVQAAGYKTNAANFRVIVNQTLIKSDRIKKVARGLYTAA